MNKKKKNKKIFRCRFCNAKVKNLYKNPSYTDAPYRGPDYVCKTCFRALLISRLNGMEKDIHSLDAMLNQFRVEKERGEKNEQIL